MQDDRHTEILPGSPRGMPIRARGSAEATTNSFPVSECTLLCVVTLFIYHFQTPFALSIATSVRIGNLLGQGNARRAGVAAATSLVIAVAIGWILSNAFLILRHKWSYIFNNDPEVVSLVASILPIVALFQVFDGTAAITAGIFRARGKQVAGAFLNLSAYYVFGIPIGLYFTFVRGHALAGLWEGLTIALMYCSGVGIWSGVRGVDWEAEVTIARAESVGWTRVVQGTTESARKRQKGT